MPFKARQVLTGLSVPLQCPGLVCDGRGSFLQHWGITWLSPVEVWPRQLSLNAPPKQSSFKLQTPQALKTEVPNSKFHFQMIIREYSTWRGGNQTKTYRGVFALAVSHPEQQRHQLLWSHLFHHLLTPQMITHNCFTQLVNQWSSTND